VFSFIDVGRHGKSDWRERGDSRLEEEIRKLPILRVFEWLVYIGKLSLCLFLSFVNAGNLRMDGMEPTDSFAGHASLFRVTAPNIPRLYWASRL
jgi:hypothetical protein